jgi:hypothetical protein
MPFGEFPWHDSSRRILSMLLSLHRRRQQSIAIVATAASFAVLRVPPFEIFDRRPWLVVRSMSDRSLVQHQQPVLPIFVRRARTRVRGDLPRSIRPRLMAVRVMRNLQDAHPLRCADRAYRGALGEGQGVVRFRRWIELPDEPQYLQGERLILDARVAVPEQATEFSKDCVVEHHVTVTDAEAR